MGSDPVSESTDVSKPPIKSGLDNPGLDQTDNSVADLERSQDGPFVTNTSGHPHGKHCVCECVCMYENKHALT